MVVVFLLTAYLVFQTSVVQTFVTRQLTRYLSEKLHTHIQVRKVDIAFFNKVILEDVLIEDQQADTLLFVGKLVASIDRMKFKQQQISLSSLALLRTKVYVSLDENLV